MFAAGILRGPAAMNGSVRGTALVMLAAGLPVLIASMLAARRRSARAMMLWLGSAAYLAYNAVMLLFATPFNHLFLLYVAMLSLSIWSVAAAVVRRPLHPHRGRHPRDPGGHDGRGVRRRDDSGRGARTPPRG